MSDLIRVQENSHTCTSCLIKRDNMYSCDFVKLNVYTRCQSWSGSPLPADTLCTEVFYGACDSD